PEGPARAPRKGLAEKHSADAASHVGSAYRDLIEIRLGVDEAECSEPDRFILLIDCDVGKPSLDRLRPANRLCNDKGVALIECQLEPRLDEKLAGLVVDLDELLQLIGASPAE